MGKIGDILNQVLKEKGLTQRALVRPGGPSLSSVARLFAANEISDFNASTLTGIAESLGMDYAEFIGRIKPGSIIRINTPRTEKEPSMQSLATPTTDQFLAWFESLPAARQRSIYGAVRAHVDEHWAASNLTTAQPARTARRTG